MLGLAFHPDYASNGRFFVHYTAARGANLIESRVVEYHASPSSNTADPNPVRTILTLDQPRCNHNAGSISFGKDGYLYIPFGDGGANAANGQNPTTWLGSVFLQLAWLDLDWCILHFAHHYCLPMIWLSKGSNALF